jgi:hypothetical protein
VAADGRPDVASLARYDMEMSAMQERPGASSTTSDALDERLPQGRPAGPPVDVRATQGLITEQEMVFGTGAAVARQHQRASHRLVTSLWQVLAGSRNSSHRRPYPPPYYLECARLSREIDRL